MSKATHRGLPQKFNVFWWWYCNCFPTVLQLIYGQLYYKQVAIVVVVVVVVVAIVAAGIVEVMPC